MHRVPLVVTLCSLSATAWAGQEVTAAFVDPAKGAVDILGSGFTAHTEVWLDPGSGPEQLDVLSVDDDALRATVGSNPFAALEVGTYRLTVLERSAKGLLVWQDELDVTVQPLSDARPGELVSGGWSVDPHEFASSRTACFVDIDTASRLEDEVVLIHGEVHAGVSYISPETRVQAWAEAERDGVARAVGIRSEGRATRSANARLGVLGVHRLAACPEGCRDTLRVRFVTSHWLTSTWDCTLATTILRPTTIALGSAP